MRLVDITVWMVRREQVAPVVWGKIHPEFGREVLGGSQVNATLQVLVTMGEWVRVGMLKGVTERTLGMEREAGHVLKVGLEDRREV